MCVVLCECAVLRCCPSRITVHTGACWLSPEPGGGRVVVLGSAGLLADAWLDKEDNSRISDFVFRWLRPVSALQLRCWWLGFNRVLMSRRAGWSERQPGRIGGCPIPMKHNSHHHPNCRAAGWACMLVTRPTLTSRQMSRCCPTRRRSLTAPSPAWQRWPACRATGRACLMASSTAWVRALLLLLCRA